MWTDIFIQNKKHLLKTLDDFLKDIDDFKKLIENETLIRYIPRLKETRR